MFSELLIFIISCLILVLSGSYLVKSLSKIAAFLRVSEFVLAFILMALATTIPELSVGIISAINKIPNLSLGNVIGSNIVDLTLILGVAILLSGGIQSKPKILKQDAIIMFFIVILPIVLYLIGGGLSRIDGIILISVFLIHAYRLLVRTKQYKKKIKNGIKSLEFIFNILIFIFSLCFLFLSAHLLVKYAEVISIELNVPEILIGLFLIAFGTSLPELVFISSSAMKGHGEFAFGDLMGSVISNSTLVIGVTALIYPIIANLLLFLISATFMIVVTFLYVTFMHTGSKLNKWEGISLIMLYIFFIIIEFYIKINL